MGMVWEARALSSEDVARIRADPEAIWELKEADEEQILAGGNGSAIDIDKAWHGVHWLLTGSAEPTDAPLSDAVMGGEEVGEDDGYGPPRLLDPARVAAVATALQGIDADTLRSRFDPAAMTRAELYPEIWTEPDIFDEYLLPSVDSLRSLYAGAAGRGDWVLQQLV